MARSRRVRQLPSEELEMELGTLWSEGVLADGLSPAQKARWRRVAREIARRDYRFRQHGQRCQCADCWYLWDVWQTLFRRPVDPIPDLDVLTD